MPSYSTVTNDGDVDQSPRGPGGGLDTSQEVPAGRTAKGVAVSQVIQWSSEYHDTDLGLIYYNFRYYNPTDGRWTRRDPIGIEGGINCYRYLDSKPALQYDILGLSGFASSDNCTGYFFYSLYSDLQRELKQIMVPNVAASKISGMLARQAAKQFGGKILPHDKLTTANGLPYVYLIYYCGCKENSEKKCDKYNLYGTVPQSEIGF